MISLSRRLVLALLVVLLPAGVVPAAEKPDGLSLERVAALRQVTSVEISPDGSHVAYRLDVQRRPGDDDDGAAWTELHVMNVANGRSRPFVTGSVNVSQVRFSSDGRVITYLAKRKGDEHKSLWAIPLAGGESRRLLEFDTSIDMYRVSPRGDRVAFVARVPKSKKRKKAEKKGFKQEVFEEDWRPRRAWVADLEPFYPTPEDPTQEKDEEEDDDGEPRELELDGSAFELEWSPDGKRLAVTLAPTPLIDDRYMARKINIVDPKTSAISATIPHSGKLGKFSFSPDGRSVGLIGAADPNDPSAGRLFVSPVAGGGLREVLPELEGHVRDFVWQDTQTLMYVADLRSETLFGEVDVIEGPSKTHAASGPGTPTRSPILRSISISRDGMLAAFTGETPGHPRDVYLMGHGDSQPRRMTDVNPWLDGVELARQEVVSIEARDGLEFEGILIHPLNGKKPAPLLLMVHGGPESNDRNGWLSNYSRPGQVAAARGYAVLYPNYRGSTGRGVEFSKTSQGDAAGKEFDDLVDAVDHLVEAGIADRDRVGINGGSYGGYATAWSATKHSKHFKAGVMFVGISNKVSKGLTTEIPVEDKMVHTRFDPWTKWQFSLERSPIYHAENSRTALLIATGTDDTRVHPSQSLQLYRALKLIDKTPVRLVRYPGEGHGNRKSAARYDYSLRLMRWMDHFVMDGNAELPEYEFGGDDDEDSED
ncbi:MAG: S9 family peptidase [bacterium]|nr:S9 family peptidase [bacterium]